MNRSVSRARRESVSLLKRSSGLVLSSAVLVLVGVSGCQGGDGDFVGLERPSESGETCNLCTPAIVPTPVNCEREEEGLEFLPMKLWDFSGSNAPSTYVYSDNSTGYLDLSDTWEPGTQDTERCEGAGTTRALHVKGGAFLNWGGGIGRHLKCLNGLPEPGSRLPDEDARPEDYAPADTGDYAAALTGEIKIGPSPGPVNRGCSSEPLHACDGLHPGTTKSAQYLALSDEEKEALHSACPVRDQLVMLADLLRINKGAAEEAESTEEDEGSEATEEDELQSARETYRAMLSAAPPEEEFLLGMTLDLTEWDGISFWARRGSNDAAAGIRISLGDKHTDDDLSYLQHHINPDDTRYCERNVECGCQGNSPCYARPEAQEDPETTRCWDLPPDYGHPVDPETGYADEEAYALCGDPLCEDIYQPMQHPDELTAGTSCNVFHNRGGVEEYHCYNPENGRPPVERTDLCGDHWVHPIRLSTEWQFYKVPFGVLLQEGWAKEQFEFDLTSAAVLRFTWGTGWQDFWVDDVRVYRNRHNTTGDGE